MDATIWHNPACSTSRNTLALIRHAGIEPVVVEYLRDPPSRERIRALASKAGLTLREAIRASEPEYAALPPDLDDEGLLNAIARWPVLLNRPFVETALGVRLCRPASERVLDILRPIAADFVNEDGQVVRARG